jgi:hypothetical protein
MTSGLTVVMRGYDIAQVDETLAPPAQPQHRQIRSCAGRPARSCRPHSSANTCLQVDQRIGQLISELAPSDQQP